MSLQNRETGEYAPPREQVNLPQQQLQEKTPAEIVTEYVRQDIAVTKKMRESVDKLMMSNELLRQSLGNELGKFSEQMSKQLTTIFVDNYRSFTETTVKAEEKQKAQTENYLSELSNEITLLKLKIKRMYHFNRFKIALLWAGWIAVIILLLMEIMQKRYIHEKARFYRAFLRLRGVNFFVTKYGCKSGIFAFDKTRTSE